MLIFDSETLAVVNSLTVETFYMYDIWYDTGQSPLRLTNLGDDLTFNGNLYSSAVIKQGEISSDSDGSVSDVTVTVGNASGMIQYYDENYQLSGKTVIIRQLFRGAQSYAEYSYVIKSVVCDSQQASITCGMGFDIFLTSIPSRIILRNFCRWRFKGEECAYAGSDGACSKQFSDCLRKGNNSNFGGFPAIVTNRVYV